MNIWDDSFADALFEATSYRSFIKTFLTKSPLWKHPRPISYGTLAKRAGYSSKTFLNDLVRGRKRCVVSSLAKISKGLDLDSLWAEYFSLLVAKEEPHVLSRFEKPAVLIEKLEKTKQKILRRRSSTFVKPTYPIVKALLHPHFPEIFAALGEDRLGAPVEAIVSRTDLGKATVQGVLERLARLEIVKKVSDTNYCSNLKALDVKGLGQDLISREFFFNSIERAKSRFPSQIQSKESLYMTQTFCVKKSDLLELRNLLAERVRSFASDSETPTGDCIAEICISFTHTK